MPTVFREVYLCFPFRYSTPWTLLSLFARMDAGLGAHIDE